MKTGRVLAAFLVTMLLAGCGGDGGSEELFVPQRIERHDRCHLCGMAILRYPGPKAEIVIKDSRSVLKFCSVKDAYTFALQPENSRRIRVFAVEDVGVPPREDEAAGNFIRTCEAVFVWASRAEGAMGTELMPFSSPVTAQAFIDKWGGRMVHERDITLSLIENE